MAPTMEPTSPPERLDDVEITLDPLAVGRVAPTADVVALEFTTFYDQHRDRVARALSLTLGDTTLGAEAADEAMTRAYGRWSTIAMYRNPEGWVYRVGVNWGRSFLRKRRREAGDLFREGAYEQYLADPSLDRALGGLPLDMRTVVVCRFLLDWSVEQTATALDIAPGTVKSRLSRALERLEASLGGGSR